MQNYIQNTFNIDSIIIRLWYNKVSSKQPKRVVDGQINVFFGGSIYAKKEFYIFLKARFFYL